MQSRTSIVFRAKAAWKTDGAALARIGLEGDFDRGEMNFSNLPSLLLAVVTGAAFGLLGYKLKKGALFWCIGGIIAALCIASICLGVAHAAAVPYTTSELSSMESAGIAMAVVVIAIIGALIWVANRGRAESSRQQRGL